MQTWKVTNQGMYRENETKSLIKLGEFVPLSRLDPTPLPAVPSHPPIPIPAYYARADLLLKWSNIPKRNFNKWLISPWQRLAY